MSQNRSQDDAVKTTGGTTGATGGAGSPGTKSTAGTGSTGSGSSTGGGSGSTGGSGGSTAVGGTGSGGARSTVGSGMGTSTGMTTTGGASTDVAGGSGAQGIAAQAKEQAQQYGQKIADAATQAKDYVSDKLGPVGDKLKDLQNKDYKQVAEDAKDYARQNPGQALLISAAAGFLIGILLRGGNNRR